MRRLISSNENTYVSADHAPEEGNVCHKYYLGRTEDLPDGPIGRYGYIQFQNGPVLEKAVNGCQNEDLLAIILDRLQHFQSGKFKCRENEWALGKIEEALHWLEARTKDRVERGVEGTNMR